MTTTGQPLEGIVCKGSVHIRITFYKIKPKSDISNRIYTVYECWFRIKFRIGRSAIENILSLITHLISGLRRFNVRRGVPCNIYSNNERTFIGANQSIKDLYKFIRDNNTEIDTSSIREYFGILYLHAHLIFKFKFSIWEAGAKSIKFHLKRVMGDNVPLTIL